MISFCSAVSFALLVMVVRSLLDADGLDNGILISGHGENLLER